jgi:hydroxymethylglutaryl-CoA reductase
MSPEDRLSVVESFAALDADAKEQLAKPGNLDPHIGDHMIENVISTISIPVGIAVNMKVDGRDVLVPMATEESSVVAAVGNSARQCYDSGGFITSVSGTLMIAQVQLVNVTDPENARIQRREEIGGICDECDPMLVKLGWRIPRS